MAKEKGKTNIAFLSYLLTGNVEECADLLIATNRLPEAAFFARTYLPSRVGDIVSLWKDDLSKVSETAAKALADPAGNPDLFPDFDVAAQVEQMFLSQREATKATGIPSTQYPTAKDDLNLDLIALVKSQGGPPAPPAPPAAPKKDNSTAEAEVAAARLQQQAEERARALEAARLKREAEEEARALEAQRLAAEQAEAARIAEEMEAARVAEEMKCLAEEAAAKEAAEKAAADDLDDFGDDW